ncbi:MAG: hypothetical protein WEA77_01180 [Hyphomonas sp.]|uniref:hypothetical protein n=1 Tax=Hyphomonas sp. TaxID=87 RepID=UPI0034A089CF
MKTLMAAFAAPASAGAASAAPLTVNVDAIEARGGTLYAGVQTEAQFMKNDGAAGEMIAAPEAGSRSFTLGLRGGASALSIGHDFNGNGTVDLAGDGRPEDGPRTARGRQVVNQCRRPCARRRPPSRRALP